MVYTWRCGCWWPQIEIHILKWCDQCTGPATTNRCQAGDSNNKTWTFPQFWRPEAQNQGVFRRLSGKIRPMPLSQPPWQQSLACRDITLTSAPSFTSRSYPCLPCVSHPDTRLWFKAHPNPARTHLNLFTSANTLLRIRSHSQVPGIRV